jgi:hypothetical protein
MAEKILKLAKIAEKWPKTLLRILFGQLRKEIFDNRVAQIPDRPVIYSEYRDRTARKSNLDRKSDS